MITLKLWFFQNCRVVFLILKVMPAGTILWTLMICLLESEIEWFFSAYCYTLLHEVSALLAHRIHPIFCRLSIIKLLHSQLRFCSNCYNVMTDRKAMGARRSGLSRLERKKLQKQSEIYKTHLDNKIIYLQDGKSIQVQGGSTIFNLIRAFLKRLMGGKGQRH